MTRRLRGEEGAAVVEFGLASMLFAALILFTIYAGELLTVALDAQEAEIAATWDVSAFALHDFRTSTPAHQRVENYQDAFAAAANAVETDLADLDSYGLKTGAALLVTRLAAPMDVRCFRDDSDELTPYPFLPDPIHSWNPNAPNHNPRLHPGGFVRCSASVQLANRGLPDNESDEFSLIHTDLMPDSVRQIRLCGIGASPQGCDQGRGGLVLLTDEWALEDPFGTGAERSAIRFDDRDAPYHRAVASVYEPSKDLRNDGAGIGDGKTQIDAIWRELMGPDRGYDRGRTRDLKLSFRTVLSEPRHLPETLHSDHSGGNNAYLTPFRDYTDVPNPGGKYLTVHNDRHWRCYLGIRVPGCAP